MTPLPQYDSAVHLSGTAGRRLGVVAASCLVLLAFAHWRVAAGWAQHVWSDEDLVHAWFAPVVAALLVWRDRSSYLGVEPSPSGWGVATVILGLLFGAAGVATSSVLLARIALWMTFCGCVAAIGGLRVLRLSVFPLGLLLFAIPPPSALHQEITVRLQTIAATAAEQWLEWIGYTVLREGNILELPGRRLDVDIACSGIRSLFTLAFLTTVYGYVASPRVAGRLALVAAAVPVSLAMNAARIIASALVSESQPRVAAGLHALSGAIFALAGFALIVLAHSMLRASRRGWAATL